MVSTDNTKVRRVVEIIVVEIQPIGSDDGRRLIEFEGLGSLLQDQPGKGRAARYITRNALKRESLAPFNWSIYGQGLQRVRSDGTYMLHWWFGNTTHHVSLSRL